MVDNLLIVAAQVGMLFILIALGFLCGKTRLFGDRGSKALTDVVLYLATPCIMIQSFQNMELTEKTAGGLGTAVLCSVLIQGGSAVVCRFIFRDKNPDRRKVLRFGAVFSNCGFMSLPLQKAVIGSEGVFYGAVFVAVFNILVWSYGLLDMSGDAKDFSIKKIILNPGVLGAIAAAAMFFLKIKLPPLIMGPIDYLSALNTPLPMLVIGYHLSNNDFGAAVRDKGIYLVMLLRLILIPSAAFLIMKLCGVSGNILTACTIASSAPVAATTTMFSDKFGRDVELSAGLVSMTTIVSIVTMPLIIAVAQTL